ncbi:hypothetical protein BDK92_0891 [Micromonospora pisi]|uniref:Uncharacterized protein n=1 Tax=Micromonospora pisi TaxID=589240 RepID=A0A495JDP9_9ACTN|nr:hypothetical protein BDK92_0891 [Micromonospora pisi]
MSAVNIVIAILIVGWLISRQLRERPVWERGRTRWC